MKGSRPGETLPARNSTHANNSGHARIGNGDTGITAWGNTAGAEFYDASDTGHAFLGYGKYGIEATGSMGGGHFFNPLGDGYATISFGDGGIY